jgi:hypothetical protein
MVRLTECNRQDLYGAVMTGSRRFFNNETFHELGWPRVPYRFPRPLPSGFEAYSDVLNDELLTHFWDIKGLQLSVERSQSSGESYLSALQIDKAQVSIESRLFSLQDATRSLGPISECCRLALYFCTYLLYTGLRSGGFIPIQLLTQLRTLLFQTSMESVWDSAPDLFLWVLLIGGVLVEPAQKDEYITMLNYCNLDARVGGWV